MGKGALGSPVHGLCQLTLLSCAIPCPDITHCIIVIMLILRSPKGKGSFLGSLCPECFQTKHITVFSFDKRCNGYPLAWLSETHLSYFYNCEQWKYEQCPFPVHEKWLIMYQQLFILILTYQRVPKPKFLSWNKIIYFFLRLCILDLGCSFPSLNFPPRPPCSHPQSTLPPFLFRKVQVSCEHQQTGHIKLQ